MKDCDGKVINSTLVWEVDLGLSNKSREMIVHMGGSLKGGNHIRGLSNDCSSPTAPTSGLSPRILHDQLSLFTRVNTSKGVRTHITITQMLGMGSTDAKSKIRNFARRSEGDLPQIAVSR